MKEENAYEGGQCQFITLICQQKTQSNFKFLQMYYCGFQGLFGDVGGILLFIPVGVLILFVGMFTLQTTAADYLSPSLAFITRRFKIPQSLAGVTLLAFGNGAPDFFASLAASSSSESIEIEGTTSMSLIFGGTLFISTVVTAMSTFASNLNPDPKGKPIKKIKVTPRFFLRDLMFFLISMVYMLFQMLILKKITLYSALGLPFLYLVFCFVVIFQSNQKKAVPENEARAKLISTTIQDEEEQIDDDTEKDGGVTVAVDDFDEQAEEEKVDQEDVREEDGDGKTFQHVIKQNRIEIEQKKTIGEKVGEMWKHAKVLGFKKVFMLFISVPMNFLRDYTIPMSSVPIKDGNEWDQKKAATIPVFYVFASLYLSGQFRCGPD